MLSEQIVLFLDECCENITQYRSAHFRPANVRNSTAFKDVVDVNRFGEIQVDDHGRTSAQGIYAAGDVTNTPYKQIVISMGDGAKASLAAFEDRMREETELRICTCFDL